LLEKYKQILFEKVQEVKILMFSQFIKGMESIEAARYFVAMLYLAMYDKVDVEQMDDDIKLILKE
jgi:chromatin segregation and condensation protein Rec8/ScpA/Scc1 (kleisin family)